ncbi:MAG: hypothetical protein NTV03_03030, partial [Candidatus Nomurabacteria bacterium]|nr:hypothetical protein [Candidatus Nomurabacteria bacterium]
MITPDILHNRIKNFWGYGSLESPVWLVGMEEGFHSTDAVADREMLERQFLLPTINGMFDASRPIDNSIRDLTNLSPFLPNSKIQSTWKFPIALLLFLKNGVIPCKEGILDFQHSILANGEKNEAATIELMPLPSPSTSVWPYGDVQGFETRESYLSEYRRLRAQGLKELVQKYSPKLIIFYSMSYFSDWVEVIGRIPEKITDQMYFT